MDERTAEKIATLAPVALLAVVACAQLAIAHTTTLTPWKGGGFGMFSTYDSLEARHLHAWGIVGGEKKKIAFAGNAFRDARAMPSEEALLDVAKELAEQTRSQGFHTIIVELRTHTHRREGAMWTSQHVLDVRYDVPDPGAPPAAIPPFDPAKLPPPITSPAAPQ